MTNCTESIDIYNNETFVPLFLFPPVSLLWSSDSNSSRGRRRDQSYSHRSSSLGGLDGVAILALVLLNMAVVAGNALVIVAVFAHSKLRRMTTNRFIVSLAVADLMVGLIVLPFSSVNEVGRLFEATFSHSAGKLHNCT